MDGAIGAARAGHDVIVSPTSHCYFDYPQTRDLLSPGWMGLITLEQVYSFDPVPPEITPAQAQHILGVEGNVWTEHAPQERVDWQAFPRLCALAEVAWTPQDKRDFGDFCRRLAAHYPRLDALGVTYFIPPPRCISLDSRLDGVSRETLFTESTRVGLENPLGKGVIHYTLDGSEPDATSPRYKEPIRVDTTTVLKARLILNADRQSDVAGCRLRKLHPLKPIEASATEPGLHYLYYEGTWQRLPDFTALMPSARGSTATFSLDMRQRGEGFGVRFEGLFEAAADGLYTFHVSSDDGSRLHVGNELVVDNDGLHAAHEVGGQVILRKGLHPIRLDYFQAGGARELVVQYEGPGIRRQTIPASALHRAAPAP